MPNRKLYRNKQQPKQSGQTPGKKTQGQNNNQNLATKSKLPLCNKDYSNAIALLMHLQMANANMTWKPMQREIITAEIIPPGMNNIQNKWLLIQEHNSLANTQEKQQQTVQPNMQKLQTFYEQQTKQNNNYK